MHRCLHTSIRYIKRTRITEDQLEQEALGWLADLGYAHLYGPDIAFDGPSPERKDYREVLLTQRLSNAIDRLNTAIPLPARQDALQQVMSLGIPSQLSANRYFNQLLVTGVPVQYHKNGDSRCRPTPAKTCAPNWTTGPLVASSSPPSINSCRVVEAREHQGKITNLGEADSAEVQVSPRSGRGGYRHCA